MPTMSTRRWMLSTVVLSLLIVGSFGVHLLGWCVVSALLLFGALFISAGAIVAAAIVLLAEGWNWLVALERRDGPPPVDHWQGECGRDQGYYSNRLPSSSSYDQPYYQPKDDQGYQGYQGYRYDEPWRQW